MVDRLHPTQGRRLSVRTPTRFRRSQAVARIRVRCCERTRSSRPVRARRDPLSSVSRCSREIFCFCRVVTAVAEQFVKLALHLVVDRSHSNPEDALTSSKKVDDLLRARRGVNRCSIAQKRDVTLAPPRANLFFELLKGQANLVEACSSIFESLDESQCHDISERIQPLCART